MTGDWRFYILLFLRRSQAAPFQGLTLRLHCLLARAAHQGIHTDIGGLFISRREREKEAKGRGVPLALIGKQGLHLDLTLFAFFVESLCPCGRLDWIPTRWSLFFPAFWNSSGLCILDPTQAEASFLLGHGQPYERLHPRLHRRPSR